MSRAKADLRRRLAARRGATGPRPAPGAITSAGGGSSGGAPQAATGPRATGAGGTGGVGGAAIARQVLSLPEIAMARRVAAFVSLAGEPSTRPLLDELRARGTRVLLPAVRADLDLDFREFSGVLVPGALGTREPPRGAPAVELARADAVIVPAVAVDPRGRRLGRGGGSYDRALRRARAGTPLIAVVDDHAIVDEVPVAAHDLSVWVIVTPTRVVRCR
ncbi:5-formyltetrahydrofolate cyclo-ligase [Frankia sp. CNm7]|uniref:5-formyltetrahydrofolate cyclo-ligase n=1 Tax=Frankia nepalensis TaxID=1836974 RepID=A0A937RK46_9ACTN|nr:5-formyltetrahydrofolate cyclo-ligase [Frankia nepalensis]MBL7514335.1 5-formyltetrahydrofolate cyclo-ligase [Frankia nepalensis]MBL7517248.1 5-formyltetrahydrofolate cyclo-ligase [Frankia nepalensis]MBL7631737.1 5-formyltetrahydrofolate cyclo-ligase [Frankia nepalensis]